MNKITAKTIAKLLNDRGFVIDDDISDYYASYTKFSSWVKGYESLIYGEGYDGGEIRTWVTQFDRDGCAYGVVDSDWYAKSSYEFIENYLMVTMIILTLLN